MEYILKKNDEKLTIFKNEQEIRPIDILKDCGEKKRVFAFHGKMGAGKTTFIKQLCKDMGVEDVVNSPTFAIVNVYEDKNGDEIYHFDCYRLKSIVEALDFGAEEYLYSGNYCFIEWPEMIDAILPEDTIDVEICEQLDGTRKLSTH